MLEALYRELGDTIGFVTIYVREAHPGERIPQPRTLAGKLAHARALIARDGIEWPVAIDDVDGALHRALGGLSASVFLVGHDGRVLFRGAASNDERALWRGVGDARVPSLRALALAARALGSTLREAGPTAVRDVERLAAGAGVLLGLAMAGVALLARAAWRRT